ncbi:MAG: hypothetical protein ACOYCD_05445, partial [Kiritimatiellia bacterium]
MLRVLKLASLMMVLALAIAAMPFKPVPLLHEDFSGYPPDTTNTVPDGFVTVYGTIVLNNTQAFNFNHDLWLTDNIVRWKINRNSSNPNRRLVYVGDGGVDPSQWSNYTAYTSFVIPATNGLVATSYKVHLMARLQGNSTSSQGYTAIYNGDGTGDVRPRYLVIRKDDFDNYVTNASDATMIACSTNTFSIKSNVVYTLKFEVQGEKLNAYFYEGTNLAAPGALKM